MAWLGIQIGTRIQQGMTAARKPTTIDQEFERLVRQFLDSRPLIQHEWRDVQGWLHERRDIICGAGTPGEVFASLNRGGQIAIGITASGKHKDFQDFATGQTENEIAADAFAYFLDCLHESGQAA